MGRLVLAVRNAKRGATRGLRSGTAIEPERPVCIMDKSKGASRRYSPLFTM